MARLHLGALIAAPPGRADPEASVKRHQAAPITGRGARAPPAHGCHRPTEPTHSTVSRPPTRRVTVPISFTGDIAGFLFDLLSDIEAIVWEADADTLAVEFVNDRVRDLLGYEPMDMIAVPGFWSDTVVHPDDREAVPGVRGRGARAGRLAPDLPRARRPAATVVWLSSVARLTIDQEGRRRIRGVETDVTAMKRAEEQARESEERFRLLSEASRDSVIVHAGGAIVEVNQAFCDQFGWTPEEALGAAARGLHRAGVARAGRQARMADGATGAFEIIGMHRSGARRWYAAQSQETRYHGELARVVVLTDITEMKEREAARPARREPRSAHRPAQPGGVRPPARARSSAGAARARARDALLRPERVQARERRPRPRRRRLAAAAGRPAARQRRAHERPGVPARRGRVRDPAPAPAGGRRRRASSTSCGSGC